ncbi:MAG: hypothetical protein OHK0040_08200 [bacterium]
MKTMNRGDMVAEASSLRKVIKASRFVKKQVMGYRSWVMGKRGVGKKSAEERKGWIRLKT